MTVIAGSPNAGPASGPSDPSGTRAPAWLAGRWDTPGKLRVGLVAMVLVCLLSGVIGFVAAGSRLDAIREIDRRTAPLSADAVEVYRSLARADAAAIAWFIAPDDSKENPLLLAYNVDITRASERLSLAATRTGSETLAADRVADISDQLLTYVRMVEGARVTRSLDGYLSATTLLRSTVLRRTQALQRDQSAHLNEQYEQARALPRAALALGTAALVTLLGMQVLLALRTKRILNLWLLTATAAVVGSMAWWGVALRMSNSDLETSRRHSQSTTDALGQAQIAVLEARADELLSLVAPDGDAYERDFNSKHRVILGDAVNSEVFGALGAASRFAVGASGQARLQPAIAGTRAWVAAHGRLKSESRKEEAMGLALDPNKQGSAAAFSSLDVALATAVDEEAEAFGDAVREAQSPLRALAVATGILAAVAAAAAALGVRQRLQEYL